MEKQISRKAKKEKIKNRYCIACISRGEIERKAVLKEYILHNVKKQ